MELRHLRYFLAVAEELHFRRAAERLHMSQPPLSQQIRALEDELGVQLLDRDRRGVALTPAGAAFREEAKAILDSVDHAVELTRRVAHGEVGRLRVAFVGTAMYGRLPELLRAFRAERPEVELRLRELGTAVQLEALRAGRIDVGFVRVPEAELDGIRAEVIDREDVVAVLPGGHPLASRDDLALTELRDEAFVLLARRQAPGLYDATVLAMAQAGGVPRVVQEVAEVQTAIGLVAAGVGLTLVPASVGAQVRGEVVARPLRAPVPQVELRIAVADGPRDALVDAFLRSAGAHI